MCAAAQTANRGQEGGGAGHAGQGCNAARWLSSLRALLLCWLPAALLHWRHAQRALASELSSGMPDDHYTALHSTRVQPIRPINLARAGADRPDPRRQVRVHCVFDALPQSSVWLTGVKTLCRVGRLLFVLVLAASVVCVGFLFAKVVFVYSNLNLPALTTVPLCARALSGRLGGNAARL